MTIDDEASVALPADLASAAEARAFVTAALVRWDLIKVLESAVLLTSELVTNAILHAGGPIGLRVNRQGRRIRIGVTDPDPAPPVRRIDLPDPGRGLMLLEALAARWGVVSLGDRGKDVWFEIVA